MRKPFKTKTVKGKKVKRMTGSSSLKLQKRAEQRELMHSKDWRGLLERYGARDVKHGTMFIIKQEASGKEGPIVFRPWDAPELRDKIRHRLLAYMEKDELVMISKGCSIPLRILARLQARDRAGKAAQYTITNTGENIVVGVRLEEGAIMHEIVIPGLRGRGGRPMPFESFSARKLEYIKAGLGIPLWLLKMVQERQAETRGKAMRLLKK